MPDSSNSLEVYKQRYDTFRHLDKLRWQMLQLALAVVPLSVVIGVREGQKPSPWVFLLAGLVVIGLASVMERIRHGINKNAVVLKKFGAIIGDNDLPTPTNWLGSVSFWIFAALVLFGAVNIAVGIFLFWKMEG